MQAVVSVAHRGKHKMVGKCFPVDGETIFYHASGNQWHIKTDSPGGVDEVVLHWLISVGVNSIHHYSNDWGILCIASPHKVLSNGILETWDARRRFYLTYAAWESMKRKPWYKIPWIPSDYQVNLSDDDIPRLKKGIPENDVCLNCGKPPLERLGKSGWCWRCLVEWSKVGI